MRLFEPACVLTGVGQGREMASVTLSWSPLPATLWTVTFSAQQLNS